MIKVNIIYLIIALFLCTSVFSQDKETEAKFLYNKAVNSYQQAKYSESMEYVNQVEATLGQTNAAIEYYRVKNFWMLQNIKETESHIKIYFQQNRTNEEWDNNILEIKFDIKKLRRDKLSMLKSQMIFVEGGTFTMGCTPEQGNECEEDEYPSRSITLDSYKICKLVVTQDLWLIIMGENPSSSKCPKCGNRSVTNVNWDDIQRFIIKLNELSGENYRLPSEAEWEFAARGGNKSKGYKYSGSNNLNEVAWNKDNSDYYNHSVGQLKSNELGIYDMSGNVWELCQDWYSSDYYSTGSTLNPKGPKEREFRVTRGGAWDGNYNSSIKNWRVSDRNKHDPEKRYNSVTFRLVLDVN